MRTAASWLGFGIIGSALIAGFIAYFITRFDPQTGFIFDGLGRPLYESPWFMRLLFGQDRLWAGWLWFGVDLVIFWGCIALGSSLASWGFKKND